MLSVLPVFTVVFESLDASNPPMTGLSLKLPDDVVCDARFRIAYDRAYLCTETCHSTIAFLEFDRSLGLAGEDHNYIQSSQCISAYTLRVVPTTDSRPPFVDLPPKIFLQIVR